MTTGGQASTFQRSGGYWSIMETRLPILVAEDDENDVTLLLRAIQKGGFQNPVHVCRDGEQAILYLQGEGDYSDRTEFPFPNIIITDLKMPRKGGLEILQWLQDHPECHVIPVIVLSASSENRDISAAYRLGANCYLKKPGSLDGLQKLVKFTLDFWSVCEKPEVPERC